MTAEEIDERAERLYREKLRAVLEPSQRGRFVAIDVETGEHFVGDSLGEAVDQANARRPGVVPFVMRIGYPTAHRIGARWPQPN